MAYPGSTTFPGASLYPGVNTSGGGGTPVTPTVYVGVFRSPIYQRRYPVIAPVTALINYSKAVLRIAGEWVETEWPTQEQVDASDYYFPGGYEIPVDQATADVLTAAGYSVEIT